MQQVNPLKFTKCHAIIIALGWQDAHVINGCPPNLHREIMHLHPNLVKHCNHKLLENSII